MDIQYHQSCLAISLSPGYEYFEGDGNYLYTMAEMVPRMAVYSELRRLAKTSNSWVQEEFAASFGDL